MNDTPTQTIADALLLLSLGNDNEIGKDASERLMKLERENAALLEDKAHLREELREANRLLVAFGPESARAARAAEKTPVGADAIMRQHLHEGGTPT